MGDISVVGLDFRFIFQKFWKMDSDTTCAAESESISEHF